MKYKYEMYDWDSQKMYVIQRVNIVDAIHYAWNYEFDVYDRETEQCIFVCWDDNESASESLKSYGLEVVDDGDYRKLKSLTTGEIFNASWQ